jgi:blue light- and temperature-responsive anti-repressor
MQQDLHRLVYHSRSRVVGSDGLVQAEIHSILQSSRRNNPALGVTGGLIFALGSFGQVLEGSCDAIEHTFECIQRDPRHGEVTLLSFAPVATRVFDRWGMAFVGQDTIDRADIARFSEDSVVNPAWLNGEEVLELLRELVLEDERSLESFVLS